MQTYVTQLTLTPGVDIYWSRFLVLDVEDGYSDADVAGLFNLPGFLRLVDGDVVKEAAFLRRLREEPAVIDARFAFFYHPL